MKNVSNLICWSVVVLLLLVGGANAGAKLFQQTPDEDSRTLQPSPKAAPNKRLTREEHLKSAYANSPRLNYYLLNMDVPQEPFDTLKAKLLLSEGKYEEAIEELKSLLRTRPSLIKDLETSENSLGNFFPKYRGILQTLAEACELNGDWQTVGKIYFLIHGDNHDEAIEWFNIRRKFASENEGHAGTFKEIIGMLSRSYISLDVDKTMRHAEESKARPSACFRIPVAHDLLDDEDVRVYALKDQLARVANPKLHYTYRIQMDGGGNEESLRQAELSHESYLKFLESMEDVYQKIESGDDLVKVGLLPDRKTCANVMVMLRKIGDLPY